MLPQKLSDITGKVKAWFEKSGAKETLDKNNPRKKGKVVKIVTVSVVILIVFVLMRGREVRQTMTKSTNTGPAEIDLKLDSKQLEEVWFKSSNKELEELKRRMDAFERSKESISSEISKQNEGFRQEYEQKMLQLGRESAQIHKELENVRKEAESGKIAPVDADKQISNLIKKKEQLEKESEEAVMAKKDLDVKPAYPPVPTLQPDATATNGKPVPTFLKKPEPPANTGAQANQGKTAPGYANLIHMDINATTVLGVKGKDKKEDKPEVLPLVDIIPVGSFFKCILLSGIDAATGMKAQTQPQVVLLKVTDNSQLPNKFKQDIRQCHIIGEAYGSLSEERAYIRANTLSCIKKDGGIINSEIQGYAAGEDGSLGVRGKVISRKGAFLARRIVASFLEGVGAALESTGTQVNSYYGGTTTTVDPADAFNVGLGRGMANAVEDLSESYKKMSEEVMPIIEIASGRKVHIVTIGETELGPTKRLNL